MIRVRAAAVGDIIVLAVPSSEVEATLQAIGQDVHEHTLILNLSSLQGPAQRWADLYLKDGHYVGAAPVLAAVISTVSPSGSFALGSAPASSSSRIKVALPLTAAKCSGVIP